MNARASSTSFSGLPGRSSRWPARLDLLQSLSGLALGLFMWVHMFFVSSILLGRDAMWTVARFFEGYFFFGRPLPWLVSQVCQVLPYVWMSFSINACSATSGIPGAMS